MINKIDSPFNQIEWQQAFFQSMREAPEENWASARKEKENGEAFISASPLLGSDSFDLSLFQESLSSNNREKIIEVANRALKESLPELAESSNFAFAFTGSDGREEKLSPYSSPLELMIFIRKKADLSSEMRDRIQAVIARHPLLFYKDLEIKCLEDDRLMSYNRNRDINGPKDERPFPTRALDAQYLAGSGVIFIDYKHAFFEELKNPKNSSELTSYRKHTVQTTMQVFRKTMERRDNTQIDLSTGEVHYNGDRIKGVKYPYLRAMQYKLGMKVFRLIQEGKISNKEYLDMPHSTIDRIQWLANRKLLDATAGEVKRFQMAYVMTLIWSGISQKNYEIKHQSVTCIPADELIGVGKTIAEFCEKLAA